MTNKAIQVLQEVGVARCISIMCGSIEINGHTFSEGLDRLAPSLPSFGRISPVLQLIGDAIFRLKHDIHKQGTFTISELIDMYGFLEATIQHDKVYALLGLSDYDPGASSMRLDYDLPWHEAFKQVITHSFSGKCSVDTWPHIETAVIKSKGEILGSVTFDENIPQSGRQRFRISFHNTTQARFYENKWGTSWIFQASAESIHRADIIILFEEASKPNIIRLCKSFFRIIRTATTPQPGGMEKEKYPVVQPFGRRQATRHITNDVLLTWAVPLPKAANKNKGSINIA